MKGDRRHPGHCQDCGWDRPVRPCTFWLNGLRMNLCAACERVYKSVLLK